ncbi:MAG: hypothetical protein SOV43_05055 [Selenomonadaceae bacterium]|nr:hypothetical protein [Selenomonadaceae bacterium]
MPSYIAIDLKSFYASVECVARGRDPLSTNLVVADPTRTDKTICLAVSPALKAFGVPGRPRLFEVKERVLAINQDRQARVRHPLKGASDDANDLALDPALAVSYIVAPPRMALYMQCSEEIRAIYERHISRDDIHAYSVDEVFIDVTPYLQTFHMTPRELAIRLIREVLGETGITATAGIGTNLYLAKIAMDIVAKHMPADENGVRLAELNEASYREKLWTHTPLTDFWRVGRKTAKKLHRFGIDTMGDIARCSIGKDTDFLNEEFLYRLFGVNAELLIDHAWGWEPCTMADIKSYTPKTSSLSSGQVLSCPYPTEKARLIVWEMADELALRLSRNHLMTDQLVLNIGYDIENLRDPQRRKAYHGATHIDHYGRSVPLPSHGSQNLPAYSCTSHEIRRQATALYDRIVRQGLLIRRVTISASRTRPSEEVEAQREKPVELDLFADRCGAAYAQTSLPDMVKEKQEDRYRKEGSIQQAILQIKEKYGKNALLHGANFLEGGTMMERNKQIGGHKA